MEIVILTIVYIILMYISYLFIKKAIEIDSKYDQIVSKSLVKQEKNNGNKIETKEKKCLK